MFLASDDVEKSWRAPQQDGNSRFNRREQRTDGPPFEKRYNKDDNNKSWDRGNDRYSKDESRGLRFNRYEEGGGKRFGERRGRYNDDDQSGRFGNSESRGAKNLTEEDKQWRKRDEDSGTRWNNRDDGGSWKKDRDNSDGGWKPKEGGGGRRNWGGDGDHKSNDGDNRKGGGYSGDSGPRKPWEKGGGGDSYGRTTLKSPKPDTLGGIPLSTVKVGVTESTLVVFTKSPAEFYVQLNSSATQLTELLERISTACESGEAVEMTFVQEKNTCLAQYSEDDSWYRGYIEETSFDSAKIYFVDYGNEENVPFDKIKTLPEDMSTLPVQAIKCRLYGVPETAEADIFSDFTAEKSLQTQFIANHFLTKSCQVVLIDEESGTNINIAMGAEGEEVSSALSKMGQMTMTVLPYPPETSLTVQLTWYQNPTQFCVQLMASHPEFRAMMQAMQCVVKTGTVRENNQLNVGDFVIARFKTDRVLYRALVKETGSATTVQYVDYGNTESVDNGSVWAMEPQYATLPVQAICCSLAGVLPSGDAWPQANTTPLDQHFEADTMECTIVKSLEDGQFLVRLVKNGEDLAAKIIEAGFAVSDIAVSEIDTALLVGQLFATTMLRMEEDCTFYVQPPTQLEGLESVQGKGIKCSFTAVERDVSPVLAANTNVMMFVDAVQTDRLQVTLFDSEGQRLPGQAEGVPAVEKICPMPVLKMHHKVWIAYASTEDGIFLHKVEFADQMSELLQTLFDFYNESAQVDQEWNAGELCAALSGDGQWYRARILETGSEAEVQFLDYGNSEIIPVANIRKLDTVFYTPHVLTLKVDLHVTWCVPVENLLELAGETEYTATILRSGDSWIAELVDISGQSITDKLVELGFAVALENSPLKRVVEGGRFVEGSDVAVSPTFIDSPTEIWVCVGDDIELVEALQDRLQEAAPKLAPLKEPKGVFGAKYSDSLWYRVIKLDENYARFIDYGNSDIVDMSDIKELSADFLEPLEGYAVRIELPITEVKEGATERLNHLLLSEETELDGEISAHILCVKESYIVADISKGSKSIIDILVNENLCLCNKTTTTGFISHINALNDFFIQEVGWEAALETINNELLNVDSFEAVAEIKINDLVAAHYSKDSKWYRARVTEKTEDRINVLFVDYGDSADATEFKALPHSLAYKPPTAKRCALKVPEGVTDWSKSAYEKFIEISADGYTQFDITFLNEEIPATIMLSANGKCISEELKSHCDVKSIVNIENHAFINTDAYEKTVYISHINSSTDFYVQEDGAEVDIDILKGELSNANEFEAIDQITDEIKSTIVGAFYPEDDSWNRAIILEVTGNIIKVLFVDYGNTADVTQVVKLTETIKNKPPIAIHCSLGKVDHTEAANHLFVELANDGNTPFLMKVLDVGDPQIVSLIIENKIVDNITGKEELSYGDIDTYLSGQSVTEIAWSQEKEINITDEKSAINEVENIEDDIGDENDNQLSDTLETKIDKLEVNKVDTSFKANEDSSNITNEYKDLNNGRTEEQSLLSEEKKVHTVELTSEKENECLETSKTLTNLPEIVKPLNSMEVDQLGETPVTDNLTQTFVSSGNDLLKNEELHLITDSLNKNSHAPDMSINKSPKTDIELKADIASSNGFSNDTSEKEERLSVSSLNETNVEASKWSPSMNRRSNIDEKIVPGCISSVKPDTSSE